MSEPRRKVIAVLGNKESSRTLNALAERVGRAVVEHGYRLVTGGLGGVMEAACRGARAALGYQEGLVLGILPGEEAAAANPFVDIVIPSNMGLARNVLVVAAADGVIALGGGSGTLSEIALASQMGKPTVAVRTGAGWADKLAGERIDANEPRVVLAAETPEEAVALLHGIFEGEE